MANSGQVNNKNVSLGLIAEYGTTDSESDTETPSKTAGNESNAPEFSEMVIKNNIINACAHGPTPRPKPICEDVTRHMIIDNSSSSVVEYEVTEYRLGDTTSDSSSSSESDIESVKDIDEVSSGDELEASSKVTKPEPPKVNGELGLDDLPPIEDLAISIPATDCSKIGTIASIVEQLGHKQKSERPEEQLLSLKNLVSVSQQVIHSLSVGSGVCTQVVIKGIPNSPAVDIDSILFLDNGAKALGKVYDVFGPVTEPHYCVRFNSTEHARERGAVPGADVFIGPKTNYTNYVSVAELLKTKGSDASWLNDVEPPPQHVDYSDDEEERKANKTRKEQKQTQKQGEKNDNDEEISRNVRKVPEKRNQKQSDPSSRIGGPSRGRGPFPPVARRGDSYIARPRFVGTWLDGVNVRTPPPRPRNPVGPFTAPRLVSEFRYPPDMPNPGLCPNTGNYSPRIDSPGIYHPLPPGVMFHPYDGYSNDFRPTIDPYGMWRNCGPPAPPGT